MPESRRAFLSRKYDELFDKASEIVKKHDPCKITDGYCRADRHVTDGLCCSGCKYLGPNGCKTKSLACRMWLCYFGSWGCPVENPVPELSKLYHDYWAEMRPVILEAKSLQLDSPRASKKESIDAVMKTGHRAPFPFPRRAS